MNIKRTLASSAVAVLAAGSFALAAPAQAAPSTSHAVNCDVDVFGSKFAMAWGPTLVSATGVTADGKTQVALKFSDLDGSKLPVPMEDFPVKGEIKGTINGEAVTFTGAANVTGAAGDPVSVPEVFAEVTGTLTTADVIITSAVWTIATSGFGDFAVSCPPTGAINWELPQVAVSGGTIAPIPTSTPLPSKTPSTTASPTATPSATPTDDPSTPAKAGKPASGEITLNCQMKGTFTKAYDYAVKVTVAGARATADDADVKLGVDFGDIPGLAPVPIENGAMRVSSTVVVGGKEVSVTGSSTVNADPNQPVPVPRQSGTVAVEGDTHDVSVKSFSFEFDPIAGAEVAADCTASPGAVGSMTVGIGALEDGDQGDDVPVSGSDGGSGGSTDATASLPRTGGADAMPVIGLWALAFGVAGAGLLVWMPRQRRSAN